MWCNTTRNWFANDDPNTGANLIGLVFSAIIFKTAFAVIAGVLFGIVLLGVILFIPLLKWNRMEISQIFKTYE